MRVNTFAPWASGHGSGFRCESLKLLESTRNRAKTAQLRVCGDTSCVWR